MFQRRVTKLYSCLGYATHRSPRFAKVVQSFSSLYLAYTDCARLHKAEGLEARFLSGETEGRKCTFLLICTHDTRLVVSLTGSIEFAGLMKLTFSPVPKRDMYDVLTLPLRLSDTLE
jgi:hypothetical protein